MRSQSLPGLLAPGGRPVAAPVWSTGGETEYPRWEVYHDGIGWIMVGWAAAAVWVEFRLAPITADLDLEGPNTFHLDYSTDGWTEPAELVLTWTSPPTGNRWEFVLGVVRRRVFGDAAGTTVRRRVLGG
jgi:hypothetical protein